jgi:hypothetical protein
MAAPEDPTPAELAAHAARMLAGLHEIAAQRRELAMLAYLIAVAREEAEARARPAR